MLFLVGKLDERDFRTGILVIGCHVRWMKGSKKMERKKITYKLICPSSSCRAKSRSDSEPSGWCCCCSISPSCSRGHEEDAGKAFWRFFLTPCPDLCRALTRWHSWGWWCFIMWSMLCMLAWTEWLGLVDWIKHKIAKFAVRPIITEWHPAVYWKGSHRSCDEGYFLVPRPNWGTHFWLWFLREETGHVTNTLDADSMLLYTEINYLWGLFCFLLYFFSSYWHR